ncbi:hypothetical protein LINPERHAP2_LOCUS35859 [Linum perenne]
MQGSNGFVVDLNMMSCSCGYWGLSGIPCHHGVSAITYFRLDVEPFVHKYYYTDYVARGYTNGIPPLLGQQAWPNVSGSAIHPPRMKRMLGRPKKARRKEASELHPSSSQRGGRTRIVDTEMVMHCRNCKEPGHNSRSCTFVATEQPTEHVQRTAEAVQEEPLVHVREEPPVVSFCCSHFHVMCLGYLCYTIDYLLYVSRFELEEEVQDSAGLANNLDIILGPAPLKGASKLLKSTIQIPRRKA